MTVHVLPFWTKTWPPGVKVSTTMQYGVFRLLSPFAAMRVETYGGLAAQNVENAWQYSKVYDRHVENGEPTPEYYRWRDLGWASPTAHRYPMGKGAVPEFSYWDGDHLDYVEARKRIYASLYARAVQDTESFDILRTIDNTGRDIILLDYDAYDHRALGMTLADVIHEPKRKMGHAFVLAMMLDGSLGACLEPRGESDLTVSPRLL